jgi:hypothetical protein
VDLDLTLWPAYIEFKWEIYMLLKLILRNRIMLA